MPVELWRGRVSAHAGKRIVIEVRENPRREGTHGHRSFQPLLDALPEQFTCEQYCEAGGRPKDLKWDLSKGYVIVE